MSTTIERWIEQSHYDIDTARAMLRSGRYLYVLFCCQQAVEKMLKAVIIKQREEFPPRIHQLVRLAKAAKVKLSEKQADFLRELSAYYIQTRYPEEITNMAATISKQEAETVLEKTEKIIQWLSLMLE